jgi:hypothetical protein
MNQEVTVGEWVVFGISLYSCVLSTILMIVQIIQERRGR